MRIINQSYKIETPLTSQILKTIERSGRTCYKSAEDQITEDSAKKFVAMLIQRGHYSVLEHGAITVRFIVDRGVSHEIVRHRLASYSQESTRFCNYTKEKFDKEITVIKPLGLEGEALTAWKKLALLSEDTYFAIFGFLKEKGWDEKKIPQWARSVLINSLKTEIVMTANPREWRHFFTMRAAPPAHPQMREVACPLLQDFRFGVPVLFDDVGDPNCMEKLPC